MPTEHKDLSVNGDGSPISLKKYFQTDSYQRMDKSGFAVLLDQESVGFAQDDDNTAYITAQDCSEQALYFADMFGELGRPPVWLYKYLDYMYHGEQMGSNQQVLDKFASGEITAETPAYKKICNLITYCKSNAESRQLIGLCILLAGALNLARKENRFPRIFIEHPETHLHPKMECKLMTLLEQIKKDYGRPADEPALEEEP